MGAFALAAYLTNSVDNIVKNILRATLTDPRESAFMLKYSTASREASSRRAAYEAGGAHIPPFLIASITSSRSLPWTAIFVEYVPVSDDSQDLAPQDAERAFFDTQLHCLRTEYEDMLFVSFPGDEKRSGGCVLFAQRESVKAILKEETVNA